MAGVAGITCITVHATRRFAVATGVAVTGYRTGTTTAAYRIQGWRVRGVRAWCQLIMRHPRIRTAQASRRLSAVHLESSIVELRLRFWLQCCKSDENIYI